MKTETIRARIDPVLKGEAEEVMQELGLTPSMVIQMLYKQIVYTRSLPFEVKIPNAATLAAMEELERGGGRKAGNVDEMIAGIRRKACLTRSGGQNSSEKITGEP